VFAPRESQLRTFGDGVFRRAYEIAPVAPPTWALGLYAGMVLKADDLLRHAVPLPGAIVAHALRSEIEEEDRRLAHYGAVERTAERLSKIVEEARNADATIQERCSGMRSSSRAPALARYLAGLGALRSDQIERLLGISRAGAHGMIARLRQTGLIATSQVSGVKLHQLVRRGKTGPSVRKTPVKAFSREAIQAFENAVADVDRLLGAAEVNEANSNDQRGRGET